LSAGDHGIPADLPNPVAIGLHRVLQEALSNGVKHSGVREFAVALRADGEQVHLDVRDNGVGFEPDVAIRSQGLGLISMRERLALVGGELSIESRPGAGTTIRACVPFLSRLGRPFSHAH
jgi:two-component system NarL family sensor kinase